MSDVTFVACGACESEGDVQLPVLGAFGPLACLNCGQLLTMVSVSPWTKYIDQRVQSFSDRQQRQEIGTRKQAVGLDDSTISRDGLEAEMAACLLLCPGMRRNWWNCQGPNRGNDLPSSLTGLRLPVEVKQTRYCDDRRGCLIVRPPRWTPGVMKPEYIDDSIYVLMHGQSGLFTLLGWTHRMHLLSAGYLNPVPVRDRQRECWGMHWSELLPPSELAAYMETIHA
jgi:hypothetical protein